jgi:hypothetical protein
VRVVGQPQPIGVIKQDRLSAVTTVHDVVDAAFRLDLGPRGIVSP